MACPPALNASQRDNGTSAAVCLSNHSVLLAQHPWLFTPSWLNPLLCLGPQDFCQEIRERNCPMAATMRPYSSLFCVFNALNIVNNALSYAVFKKQEAGAALTQRIVALLLKSLSLIEIFFHFFFLMFHITEYCLLSSALTFPGIGSSIFFCLLLNLLIVLQTTFHVARNWIIVIISTFRYEAVCRALKPVKVFTSVARVHAIVVAVVVFALIVSLPRIVYYSCVACDRGGGDYSLDSLELRLEARHYAAYKKAYLIATLLIFQTGGPILTVCVFSCCIMLGLRRHKRLKQTLKKQQTPGAQPQQPQRQQSGGSQQAAAQQASRGNLLVIVLCVTFLVLEFPLFISKILEGKITDGDTDALIVHLSKFATLFDSFINIFIYSISNRRFRQDLCRLVRLNRLAGLCRPGSHRQRPSATEESVALRTVNAVLPMSTKEED